MESMTPRQWAVGGTAMVFIGLIGYFGQARLRTEPLSDKPTAKTIRSTSDKKLQKIVVEIRGAVLNPGVYELSSDSRLEDLIRAAGGLTDQADSAFLKLASRLTDGSRIDIPSKSVQSTEPTSPPVEYSPQTSNSTYPPQNNSSPMTTEPTESNNQETQIQTVNINTASIEELEAIPNIGRKVAENIVAYREKLGPYKSLDELLNVTGIGPSTLEKIREHLTL